MTDGATANGYGLLERGASLAGSSVGASVRITSVRLDEATSAWLSAVGLSVGDELVVLRRAAFGGPLHVRTASGGEFAIGREVAGCLEVTPAGASR